jgi:ribosome biogenesis GTPase / thiamine phosphate phosphatase
MKLKSRQKGESYYEPRLESKKYRRQSRRTQHQTLDAMMWDAEAEED